ncbi:cysteine-rich receptor-like protein kinase 10 [Miscanthus floridulus]|uniref:cysteine-rich receptor-like protein kinase 10 n=1 Tax=Miscanthus floridulus TaxID=154761 RepID=UPI00345976C5
MNFVIFGVLVFVLGGGGLRPSPAAADVFCDNLKQVAATLPKNTSSSPVQFATSIVGQAPDVVYALAFCQGDYNATACGECVAQAFNITPPPDQHQQCYNDSFYSYKACPVFWSRDNVVDPSNATGQTYYDAPFVRRNIKNVTGDAADVRLITGLIHELVVDTVERAASTAPRRFATGVMDSGTTFPMVYSMAQCTPDLSAGDCLACLRRLVNMVNSTMALRMGAQIHVIRCYFRYESFSFYDSQPMLRLGPVPAPAPTPTPTILAKHKSKLWVIPVVLVPLAAAAAVLCFIFYSPWFRRYRKGKTMRPKAGSPELQGEELVLDGKNSEFSVFEFEQILEATDNFSDENELGEGGFGAVYKGQFAEGLEIAVKRLASHSGQGFTEFKNEVQLIAKLQHSNLVRLLGYCSQEEEKILVYEYLPNKSLDFFIFDENRRTLLDWPKLLAIIEGIAHGLNYLHKHSRLRVIHRDLKPSNILLDQEMNPKISDFGLAKIFSSNNIEGNTTRRVVGTYGYMAPEYAWEGIFSVKSDVFSFGVLVLEIISGKRNSGSHQRGGFINLIGYAWQLWDDGRWIDLVDAFLVPKSHSAEMTKCIRIALLCVQENATDRPTMAEVVAMLSLSSETAMIVAEPKQPAYFNVRVGNEETSTATESCSINDVTISVTTPR